MTAPGSGGASPGWYVPPQHPVPPPRSAPPAPYLPAAYVPPAPYAPAGYAPAAVPSWHGPRLAKPGARLGAALLELLLAVCLLFVGWLLWSFVAWGRGQTPAKAVLRQRVVDQRTGVTATWGQMFVRQVLVGGLLASFLSVVSLYVYALVDAAMVFSGQHRRLTDRIAGTLVLQD